MSAPEPHLISTPFDLYKLLDLFSPTMPLEVNFRARRCSKLTVVDDVLQLSLVKNSCLGKLMTSFGCRLAGHLRDELVFQDDESHQAHRQLSLSRIKREDLVRAYEVLERLAHEDIELRYTYRVRNGVMTRLEFYYRQRRYTDIIDLLELDNNSALVYIVFNGKANQDDDVAGQWTSCTTLLRELENMFPSHLALKLHTLAEVIAA